MDFVKTSFFSFDDKDPQMIKKKKLSLKKSNKIYYSMKVKISTIHCQILDFPLSKNGNALKACAIFPS